MKHNIVRLFYSNLPVVICTKNSYVAEANAVAASRLHHIAEGETLYEHMMPYDKLRYEAAYDSIGTSPILLFPLDGYHGFHYAAAIFETLMGRRFAEVCIFRSEDGYQKNRLLFEQSDVNNCPPEKVSEFLTSFSHIDAGVFDSEDYSHMIDLKAVTNRAINDISDKSYSIDASFEYSENKEMEDTHCMPSVVSVGNYLKMLISIVYVMNDITSDRIIRVRMCRYGNDTELRVSTATKRLNECVSDIDGLTDLLPSCSVKIAVCNYIAGQSGALLGVSQTTGLDSLTLTLLISEAAPENVDFKSRNQFKYYSNALSSAADNILKLDCN